MMMNKISRAFTLIEMVLALTVFSLFVVGVLMAVNNGYRYVENAEMQTMAVNLAREGVEMMYTIRDTNWRNHSGEKDKYWLLADPFNKSNTASLITEGYYYLKMKTNEGQVYPSLQKCTDNGCSSDLYENFVKYLSSSGSGFKVDFS